MKVKIGEHFRAWFKKTNPHLFKKESKPTHLAEEIEEYINDVLLEHMEQMNERFYTDNEDDKHN